MGEGGRKGWRREEGGREKQVIDVYGLQHVFLYHLVYVYM